MFKKILITNRGDVALRDAGAAAGDEDAFGCYCTPRSAPAGGSSGRKSALYVPNKSVLDGSEIRILRREALPVPCDALHANGVYQKMLILLKSEPRWADLYAARKLSDVRWVTSKPKLPRRGPELPLVPAALPGRQR